MFTLLLFVLHIVLTRIRKGSANKWYRNTVKDLLLPNTVNQKDEKPYTAGLDDTAIPHIKIKITEIPLENKLNTVMSPSLPLVVLTCKLFQKNAKQIKKSFPVR